MPQPDISYILPTDHAYPGTSSVWREGYSPPSCYSLPVTARVTFFSVKMKNLRSWREIALIAHAVPYTSPPYDLFIDSCPLMQHRHAKMGALMRSATARERAPLRSRQMRRRLRTMMLYISRGDP